MIKPSNSGFSLIEVLVTIVILLIGLLGLAGLQGRALTTQLESYQRAQALVLLQDMADRVSTNRKNAADYINNNPLGTGAGAISGCNASGVCATTAQTDLYAWNTALQGSSETLSGNKVGAMIGARGCIYRQAAPASGVATTYWIVVAWQGINITAEPDITFAYSAGQCGNGQYTDDSLHRVIALPVSVADLL